MDGGVAVENNKINNAIRQPGKFLKVRPPGSSNLSTFEPIFTFLSPRARRFSPGVGSHFNPRMAKAVFSPSTPSTDNPGLEP